MRCARWAQRCDSTNDGYLPTTVSGTRDLSGPARVSGTISSQYLTSLLIIAPIIQGDDRPPRRPPSARRLVARRVLRVDAVIPVMKPLLGEEEAAAAAAAVASGWVAQGPRVREFEAAFAALTGATEAVAVSSCTTGLHLALLLAGIGPGDEVVVPSLSFIATANAVRYVGATPVFADVELGSGNLATETIAPVISSRTRAVILVHQAGIPADIDAVHELCDPQGDHDRRRRRLCHRIDVSRELIGRHSDLVAFSFHPRKLITTGEGGMLTMSDPAVAKRARRLREHGMDASAADRHAAGGVVIESYLETGFNWRMTDIQAAVGIVQLGRLTAIVERRRELAARYHQGLRTPSGRRDGHRPELRDVELPVVLAAASRRRSHQPRRHARPSARGRHLGTRRGIMASHLEPAYGDVRHAPLPVTERLTRNSLILPLFHDLDEADQDHIIDVVCGAIDRTERS